MAKLYDTSKKQETAVLAGVIGQNQKTEQAEEYLEELAFLAYTAGASVQKKYLQRLPHPNPRTFIGEGKLAEIVAYVKEHQIDMVIFDDELTPSQIRNIEKELKCKILDRSNLILDIFAHRARTAQARFQVELAQAQYMMPRLTRMWTHLTKHQGGIGTRGPGESEIETDRRVLRSQISKLKERLEVIDKQSFTRRQNRDDKARISLVGYTNVGKSTLLNILAKSDVLAEDKLFATLDSTVRKIVINNTPFLLSDTVGFIRKLPHQLVECFKSTLDEIREADLLIHVVDASHPNFEEQIKTVNHTLQEINAHKTPRLLVFNKIDQMPIPEMIENDVLLDEQAYISHLKSSWMAKENAPVVFISAKNNTNISELRNMIYQKASVLKIPKGNR